MAYSKEQWERAKAYYEAGLSLSQIKDKTSIARNTVSQRAKKEHWEHSKSSDYIEAKELIAEKKGTEKEQTVLILDEVADDRIRRKNLVYGITEKLLKKIDTALDTPVKAVEFDSEGKEIEVEMGIDSKSSKEYMEAIDKASVTLNINQRHANSQINVNNQNNVQNVVKTLEDFYEEI